MNFLWAYYKSLNKRDKSMLGGLLGSAAVLLLNLIFGTWALIRHGGYKALGDLYVAQCGKARVTNLAIHLFVNICSAVVFSSCNYYSQILVAPTRGEVSRCHMKGDWVDIGAPSFRNLLGSRIHVKRKILFGVILILCMPLHLLWNSVFFDVIPINSYQVAIVTKDYKDDKRMWNSSFISDGEYWITYIPSDRPPDHNAKLRDMLFQGKLERLNSTECITRYLNTDFQHKDVVLVSSNTSMADGVSLVPGSANSSLIYLHRNIRHAQGWMWGSNWMCSEFIRLNETHGHQERPKSWCTKDFLIPKADPWTLRVVYWTRGHILVREVAVEIDHCLSAGSEKIKDGCAIRYSMALLILVTSLNAAILILMILTWRSHVQNKKDVDDGHWQKEHLVVLGDAISSFLQHPDDSTSKSLFVQRQDCSGGVSWSTSPSALELNSRLTRLMKPARWYQAVSSVSWTSAFLFLVALILGLAMLLIKSMQQLADYQQSINIPSLWRMGIGEMQEYAISLTAAWGNMGGFALYGSLLLANVPQLLIGSCWYLMNSILTQMLVSHHWARFAITRKTLRVSLPRGEQRSSYDLSLPYRYSIPLLVTSTMIHWLFSQSIFAVETRGFTYNPNADTDSGFVRAEYLDGSVVGYASIGFFLCLLAMISLLIALFSLGLRRLPDRAEQTDLRDILKRRTVTRLALSSTCSVVISAACHPDPWVEDSHLLPIQWGKMESGAWSLTNQSPLQYSWDSQVIYRKRQVVEAGI